MAYQHGILFVYLAGAMKHPVGHQSAGHQSSSRWPDNEGRRRRWRRNSGREGGRETPWSGCSQELLDVGDICYTKLLNESLVCIIPLVHYYGTAECHEQRQRGTAHAPPEDKEQAAVCPRRRLQYSVLCTHRCVQQEGLAAAERSTVHRRNSSLYVASVVCSRR